jgi:hypothetical protein
VSVDESHGSSERSPNPPERPVQWTKSPETSRGRQTAVGGWSAWLLEARLRLVDLEDCKRERGVATDRVSSKVDKIGGMKGEGAHLRPI